MLSDKSRPVIEATLPAVADNIQTIAERFYQHLFGEHPELLDGVFNRGNQAEGSQQQALAGSVAMFASALVNHPDQLPWHLLSPRRAQARLAGDHAGRSTRSCTSNLFWAIADVLGDAVTPEVAAAWSEVYWLMAYALINQERGLYSARGVRPETVWRDWEVTEKIRETDDVVTFRLKRTDDRLVRTSLPGQYVTVQVPMPDGVRQPRQYSLTRGRRRRAPPVLREAGDRQRQAGRRGVQPAVRHGRRRRPADDVAAVRRRRPRRLRPPGGVLQRRHRHHPDGRDALAPGRRGLAPRRPPAARRRRRGAPSRCASRSSPTSGRCRTGTCTSGSSRAPTAACRWTACTPGG